MSNKNMHALCSEKEHGKHRRKTHSDMRTTAQKQNRKCTLQVRNTTQDAWMAESEKWYKNNDNKYVTN